MDMTSLNRDSEPLTTARRMMQEQGVTALLVRSTDRYFNEYVPKELSIRAKLTGFDGSVGDAIITKNSGHLFVDGRYRLQARTQAKDFHIHVTDNALSIETAWLKQLSKLLKPHDVLAYDPNTVDLKLFDRLVKETKRLSVTLVPENIFKTIMTPTKLLTRGELNIIKISDSISGLTVQQKLKTTAESFSALGIDGFLLVKLDDIAWISNLRSTYFPYQSSIPGIACVVTDGIVVASDLLFQSSPIADSAICVVKEGDLFHTLKHRVENRPFVLGIDISETSKAHEIALSALDIEIKAVDNPISKLKAIKNEKELLHMRSAFKKADHVVYQTQNFVIASFEQKNPLTEGDVDDYVKEQFKKSGSQDLSFRPICAGGKNGAIIHYGTPDHKEDLKEGSLFLLDTGAYYEGGYATDLTRTFFAAKKSDSALSWQRQMFTLVLKASIRGLSARLRRGSIGMQLDAIVRAPLWQVGLDFAHGTGHGVGINVHEFPPRIGPSSTTPLVEGQVFSIEPGLYFEDLGGVRIENLATIVADKERPDFVRVLPLTFCPLDDRLIEEKMLDAYDKQFIEYYKAEWENSAPWPNLPPLPHAAEIFNVS